jgi:hypothetical protein
MGEPRQRAKAREREREIESQLRALQNGDAKARREAALYLGEAGAGEAVGELIDVYETDEDKSVRKAAAYALGQFKAIDKAMAKGKKEQVEKLLKRVEVEGRLGGRAPNGAIMQIVVLLLVLLGILSAAYIFAPQLRAQFGEVAEVVQAVAAPDRDRPTLVRDTEGYFNALRGDSEALLGEYQKLLSGQAVTCGVTFANPPTYLVSPADTNSDPDIAFVVSRLNTLRDQFVAARVAYDENCAGTRTLSAADSGALLQPLVQIREAFGELQSNMNSILGLPTPTPTADPNAAALPSSDIATQVVLLIDILNAMDGETGAGTLLVQYWNEAGNTGITVGCAAAAPVIPTNIALPTELEASAPNLTQAVVLVNSGLNATRNGWNQLVASCAENTVSGRARAELLNAQSAVASFGLARELLNAVSSGQP